MYCLVLGVIRLHLPVPRTAPPSTYLCVFLSTSHCEPSVLGSSFVLSPFSWGPKLYPKAAPPHLRPIHNTLRTVLAHTMNHPQHSRNHPLTTETPLSAPLAASLSSRRSSIKDEGCNATAELRSILICQIWGKSIFYCWEAPNYKGVF